MAEGSSKAAPRRDSGSSGGSGVVGAIVRNLVTLVFLGISVMSVYNVFGVGEEVEKLAKEKACQGQPMPCSAGYTKIERTPFAHSFKMYTSTAPGKPPTSAERDIACQRQYIFLGDYACKVKGEADGAVAPVADSTLSPFSAVPLSSSSFAPIRFPPKAKATPAPKATASAAPAGSAGP